MIQVVKYLLEGLAVSIASHLVAGNKLNVKEIALLGVTAGLVFMVLDHFTPSVAAGTRHGAGFGLGHNLVSNDDFSGLQLGAGPPPATCPPGQSMVQGKCEPDCQPGYTLTDYGCRPNCQPGYMMTNRGACNPIPGWTPPAPPAEETSNPPTTAQGKNSKSAIFPQLMKGVSPPRRADAVGTDYNLTPTCPTGYLLSTTSSCVPALGGGRTVETFDSIVNPNVPHKLVDGVYSAKVLLAGFNENAKAYNDVDNCVAQSAYPWGGSVAGNQVGGAEGEAEAEAEAVAGEAQETIDRDGNYRKAGFLYSGDLVDITSGDNFIQRGAIDSEIIFDKPLPKVGTNLSKLRLVHPKHETTKQTPLNYGEAVYIMHNAYYNNMNQSKYIKYGEKLQSHQDGPLFRAFKIYDAENTDRKGPIEPGTELIIARGDQEGENIYLKVGTDKTITSKNPKGAATRFKITLKRVYEIYDKNLCVCPNEIIYP